MDKNEAARPVDGGYGDDQGTRIGAPDSQRKPAQHSDTPPDRPERQTGAGSEPTAGTRKAPDEHDREHRGGYGGAGGQPVNHSDERQQP
ncbi:MAG TPA: hypothetical protein VGG78_07270 [Gemmatimonadaceae bacterium]|jgi:hypothetical protein